jgi:hypothetical protein
LRKIKQVVIFADRREQVLNRLIKVVALNKGAIRRKAKTKVFKKLSKTLARLKEVVLHPLRETRRHCESNETKTRRTRS